MSIMLKLSGITDNFLHTDRYRQNLANELAKCEFSLTKAKPRQKCENMKMAITLELLCEIL